MLLIDRKVDPFTSDKFSQNVTNLFPQVDRDTPISDPDPAVSYARSIPIGEVVVDDVKRVSLERQLINLSKMLMLVLD